MTATVVDSYREPLSGFTDSLETPSLDLGTGTDRWVIVAAMVHDSGGFGGVNYSSCKIGGVSGTAMTSDAADEVLTGIGIYKTYRLQGASVPSGNNTIYVKVDAVLYKMSCYVVWGAGSSALGAATATAIGSSTSPAFTVSSASGDLAVAALFGATTGSSISTYAGASGTTLDEYFSTQVSTDGYDTATLHKAGASSVTLNATISNSQFTPGWWGRGWSVTSGGGGGPVTDAATGSAITVGLGTQAPGTAIGL